MPSLNLFQTEDLQPYIGQSEKTAVLSANLSSPTEEWEREIMDFAYKVYPWLADYNASVEFVKKIPDRQYGLGTIYIDTKKPAIVDTASPASSLGKPVGPKDIKGDPGSSSTERVVPVHIPVIVRDGILAPLDIFISQGLVFPLEEQTLKKAVESSSLGVGTSTYASDPTLIGYLWPPTRSIFGGPSGIMGLSAISKFSSVDDDEDFVRFVHKTGSAEVDGLLEEDGFPVLQRFLSGESRVSKAKLADIEDYIGSSSFLGPRLGRIVRRVSANLPEMSLNRGTVAQTIVGPGGMTRIRATDPDRFHLPDFQDVGRTDLEGDPIQMYSINPPTACIRSGSSKKISFSYPSICKCKIEDADGDRSGLLFSTVIDVNGSAMSKSLFLGPKGWCVEPTIRAEVEEEVDDVKGSPVGGTGTFVLMDGKKAVCMTPLRILGSEKVKQGRCYKALSMDSSSILPRGEEIKVYIAEGVMKPIYSGSILLVPASAKWVGLGENRFKHNAPLELEPNKVSVKKLASDVYLFKGEPVKGVLDSPVNALDASLALVALGLEPEKVAEVLESDTDLVGCRYLRARQPVGEIIYDIDDDLMKSAAVIDDPNTIDAVLGINLLETESEENFMSLAKDLERAQQKVARLLLLSRLGLGTIPEAAAKIVMSRLTPVIESLKVLALKNAYKL